MRRAKDGGSRGCNNWCDEYRRVFIIGLNGNISGRHLQEVNVTVTKTVQSSSPSTPHGSCKRCPSQKINPVVFKQLRAIHNDAEDHLLSVIRPIDLIEIPAWIHDDQLHRVVWRPILLAAKSEKQPTCSSNLSIYGFTQNTEVGARQAEVHLGACNRCIDQLSS